MVQERKKVECTIPTTVLGGPQSSTDLEKTRYVGSLHFNCVSPYELTSLLLLKVGPKLRYYVKLTV